MIAAIKLAATGSFWLPVIITEKNCGDERGNFLLKYAGFGFRSTCPIGSLSSVKR